MPFSENSEPRRREAEECEENFEERERQHYKESEKNRLQNERNFQEDEKCENGKQNKNVFAW